MRIAQLSATWPDHNAVIIVKSNNGWFDLKPEGKIKVLHHPGLLPDFYVKLFFEDVEVTFDKDEFIFGERLKEDIVVGFKNVSVLTTVEIESTGHLVVGDPYIEFDKVYGNNPDYEVEFIENGFNYLEEKLDKTIAELSYEIEYLD